VYWLGQSATPVHGFHTDIDSGVVCPMIGLLNQVASFLVLVTLAVEIAPLLKTWFILTEQIGFRVVQ